MTASHQTGPAIRVAASAAPPAIELRPGGLPDAPVPVPAAGAVDVWLFRPGELAPRTGELARSLSPDEQARRDRLVREEDRARFVLYRGAVRRVLAAYLGTEPEAIRFTIAPGGKPGLAAPLPDLAFNLSDTRSLLALACAVRGAVGIDVEEGRGQTDIDGIAARFFHAREQAALAALPADERRVRFLRWWTAKEALLKARGQGIAAGLGGLDFSPWTDASDVDLTDERGTAWSGVRFRAAEGAAGTLVALRPVARVIFRTATGWDPRPA